jgi:predicted site-specific integrase-resolvase
MSAIAIPEKVADSARDLLSETQAAELLQVAPGTLSVWRSTGRYRIPYLKVGARVRYRRGDLLSWLDTRVRESGTTA